MGISSKWYFQCFINIPQDFVIKTLALSMLTKCFCAICVTGLEWVKIQRDALSWTSHYCAILAKVPAVGELEQLTILPTSLICSTHGNHTKQNLPMETANIELLVIIKMIMVMKKLYNGHIKIILKFYLSIIMRYSKCSHSVTLINPEYQQCDRFIYNPFIQLISEEVLCYVLLIFRWWTISSHIFSRRVQYHWVENCHSCK